MVTFDESATEDEIRAAVVAWSELLAQEKHAEALAMFLQTREAIGYGWTPEFLRHLISNYGCYRPGVDSSEHREVTSLFAQPDPEKYIADAIEVDRENLYGRDPEQYVGMVHYNNVPLDGEPSDLTARFHIKRVGPGRITLEFLDIGEM
jgi:hypothetical protein